MKLLFVNTNNKNSKGTCNDICLKYIAKFRHSLEDYTYFNFMWCFVFMKGNLEIDKKK